MKPRKMIKAGIILGEIMLMGIIVFLAAGKVKVQEPAAEQLAVESQNSVGQEAMVQEPLVAVEDGETELQNRMVSGLQDLFGRGGSDDVERLNGSPASPLLSVECGPPEDWVVYQVKAGDSLGGIARQFDVSASALQNANCLGDSEVVVAGMTFFVPQMQTAVINAPAAPAQQDLPAAPAPSTAPQTSSDTQAAAADQPDRIVADDGAAAEEETAKTFVVDVRDEADAPVGSYESNPGMGWQYRGGSFPVTYPAETVAYSQRNKLSWRILNPAEGKYNWGPLDAQLNTAVSQGKQFSFRVYTMIGEYFGGHQVPDWVLDRGAVILPSGGPDYANCTYQQEWGKFVNALIARYDGNPNIAFVDISGYGNFNEWGWQDGQTQWDDLWAEHYANGTAGPKTMSTMDSYARRMLVDMFVGGSFSGHQCVDANNQTQTYDYKYPGFKSTQLVMPYAGLVQSTQYVFTKTKTVGFRHDCLGRDKSKEIVTRLGNEIAGIWPNAPVIYETCKPDQFSTENAQFLIRKTHPSLIHDVNLDLGTNQILNLVEPVGYEYALNFLSYPNRARAGEDLHVIMEWQNDGVAPSYPRMGQKFELHVYLVDADNQRVADMVLPADISSWMPSAEFDGTPPVTKVDGYVKIPENLKPGIYTLDYSIIDTRTGEPIWLPKKPLISTRMRGIIISN